MRQTPFNELLKRLGRLTGDYPDITDEELDDIADWRTLLAARITEVWEVFDWNELCDIESVALTRDKNFAFFELPDGKIFLEAFSCDPRQVDIEPDALIVRQIGEKFRVPTKSPDEVFVRVQQAAPNFLAEIPPAVPSIFDDTVIELTYSDVLSQNGNLSKAQVRRNFGYAALEREIKKQTRTRAKRITIKK